MEVSEKVPIFALSEHLFWLSGQNPERAGLYDTALGARHHDNYSIFKNHPARGGFYRSYILLNLGRNAGSLAILRFTEVSARDLLRRSYYFLRENNEIILQYAR